MNNLTSWLRRIDVLLQDEFKRAGLTWIEPTKSATLCWLDFTVPETQDTVDADYFASAHESFIAAIQKDLDGKVANITTYIAYDAARCVHVVGIKATQLVPTPFRGLTSSIHTKDGYKERA